MDISCKLRQVSVFQQYQSSTSLWSSASPNSKLNVIIFYATPDSKDCILGWLQMLIDSSLGTLASVTKTEKKKATRVQLIWIMIHLMNRSQTLLVILNRLLCNASSSLRVPQGASWQFWCLSNFQCHSCSLFVIITLIKVRLQLCL